MSSSSTVRDAPLSHDRSQTDEPALSHGAHGGSSQRSFVLARLHSLSGVAPVGVFLAEHLYTNASAAEGRVAYEHAVAKLQQMPALWALELFGIVLPIAFHGLYGLLLVARGGANVGRYAYARNWMYLLQRVTGVAAFAFIGLHLWQYRVAKLLGRVGSGDFYAQLARDLNVPWVFAAYVLGTTASVFHLANGLWSFGNTWGLTVTPRALRRSAWIAGLFGLVLWVLGMNTLLHFAFRCGGVLPLWGMRPVECLGLP